MKTNIFILIAFLIQLSLSDAIMDRLQTNLVEKTGVGETLFDQIKREVLFAIDITARERTFGYTGEAIRYNSVDEAAAFYKAARMELVDFSNKVLRLYRPLVVWTLTSPDFSLKKVNINSQTIKNKDMAVEKLVQASDFAHSKGASVWNSIKNGFKKMLRPQSIASALKKRSDQAQDLVLQHHIDNLIREQYIFREQHPE